MKKHIKSIAAFCAMTMIFGMFSATAFAGNEEPASNDPAVVENLDDTQEQAEDPASNEPVRSATTSIDQAYINANGGKMPETAGTYTLSGDISVSKSAIITAAGSQVTIDLAGHTITYTGTENLYTIGWIESAKVNNKDSVLVHGDIVLTIKDTGSSGKIIASGTTKGSDDHWISINGSYPSHGTESYKRGGCILVQNSCTFILEGGEISGFHSESDGGAIHVSNGGHCVMSGGRITNCHSDSVRPNDDGAGAISCHCTSKGTSIGNVLYKSSEDEDAVVTTISLKGSLKITGGQIDHCSGKQGGAIRILRADFEMTGGTIENNTGLNGGGILYMRNNKGSFKVSGNPVISGNHSTSEDKIANVWFCDGATATLSGDLASTAKIEFGTSNVNSNVFNINGKNYSLNSFVCDHENYIAYVSSGNIKIKAFTMPKVSGYNIGISGEILFNVYVNFGQAAQSDVSINYTYSYKKTGSNEVVFNKDVTEFAHNDNGYYFVIPVQSACMTSPITITLTYQGKETEYTTTVEEVAYDSVEQDASYENLVKALLTYGGYAQIQLKINTGKLPVVAGVDFSQDFSPAAPLTPQEYNAGNDAFDGAVLSLLSETNIKLSFKKSVLGDTAPTMTVTFGSESYTLEGTSKGNDYVYTIKGSTENSNGFPATAYNSTFTYSFESGISGEYSIFTYLQVAKAKGSNAMKNLAEAYYNFALECEAIAG